MLDIKNKFGQPAGAPPFLTGSRLHGHLVRCLKNAIAE